MVSDGPCYLCLYYGRECGRVERGNCDQWQPSSVAVADELAKKTLTELADALAKRGAKETNGQA